MHDKNVYASISDKIYQEIILMVDNVFNYYHIVLTDMLDLKMQCGGSFTRTINYDNSTVD